jgi:hypothetical protein
MTWLQVELAFPLQWMGHEPTPQEQDPKHPAGVQQLGGVGKELRETWGHVVHAQCKSSQSPWPTHESLGAPCTRYWSSGESENAAFFSPFLLTGNSHAGVVTNTQEKLLKPIQGFIISIASRTEGRGRTPCRWPACEDLCVALPRWRLLRARHQSSFHELPARKREWLLLPATSRAPIPKESETCELGMGIRSSGSTASWPVKVNGG